MNTIERAVTIFLLAATIVMVIAVATTDVPDQEPKPEIHTALYCELVDGEAVCTESP